SCGLQRYVLPSLRPDPAHAHAMAAAGGPLLARVRRPAAFTVLATAFVLSTFGSMSLTTMLIPVLVARGHSPTTGATVLAALGVMQLPGRIWVLRGGRACSIRGLLGLQLGLQVTGMLL